MKFLPVTLHLVSMTLNMMPLPILKSHPAWTSHPILMPLPAAMPNQKTLAKTQTQTKLKTTQKVAIHFRKSLQNKIR